MPNLDGTGPDGQGPRTGRGMGRCQKGGAKGTKVGVRRKGDQGQERQRIVGDKV